MDSFPYERVVDLNSILGELFKVVSFMQIRVDGFLKRISHCAIEFSHYIGLHKVSEGIAEPTQEHRNISSLKLDVKRVRGKFGVRNGDLVVLNPVNLFHLRASRKFHGEVLDVNHADTDVLNEPRVSCDVVIKFKVEAYVFELGSYLGLS